MNPDLQTEVAAGPLAAELAPHLAAGEYGAAADVLNRRDIPATREIEARKAKTVLLVHGLWGNIKSAAQTPAHPVYAAALAAYEIGNDPGGMFDFAGATARPMMDGLQAVLLITPEARAEIEALCATTISRAEQVFGRPIHYQELMP